MRLAYFSTSYQTEPTDGVVEPFEADLTGKFRGGTRKIRRLAPPQVSAIPSPSY